MSLNIEKYLSVVQNNGGITTALPVTINGDLTVTGTTTIAGVTLTNLTVSGDTVIGNAVTDTTTITGATTIQSTSASAFTVGATAGGANPALRVDASAASQATGITIVGAAAAGGVAVAARSSGTDESLTIDAKGSGTITLNGTATGNIVAGRALTGVSSSMTGAYTAKSSTAIPATAGAVAAGAPFIANSNGATIEWITDVPTHTRIKGSIAININGNSSSTRMYINTDGAGTWTSVTTAA